MTKAYNKMTKTLTKMKTENIKNKISFKILTKTILMIQY